MDNANALDVSGDERFEIVSFQIGQCRLIVDIRRTMDFYATLPKISVNCPCENCKNFETDVIRHTNRLFEVLVKMGVDLSRQPDINPDGISCIGDTNAGNVGYMGYYYVFGKIGKTSKKTRKQVDTDYVAEVSFNDAEFGKNTQVTIKQVEEDKLIFEFYMDVSRV